MQVVSVDKYHHENAAEIMSVTSTGSGDIK